MYFLGKTNEKENDILLKNQDGIMRMNLNQIEISFLNNMFFKINVKNRV